jgi:hypothetical protein
MKLVFATLKGLSNQPWWRTLLLAEQPEVVLPRFGSEPWSEPEPRTRRSACAELVAPQVRNLLQELGSASCPHVRCNRFRFCKLPKPVALVFVHVAPITQVDSTIKNAAQRFWYSPPPIMMCLSPSPSSPSWPPALHVYSFHIQECSGLGLQEATEGEHCEYTFLQHVFKPLQRFPCFFGPIHDWIV